MTAVAEPASRPPCRWPAWRLAVPALAALTVLVAIAAALVAPADDPDRAAPGAREILLLAAAAAGADDPIEPRPDQFIYKEIVHYPNYGVIEDYVWNIVVWASVDGSRDGEMRFTSIDECGESGSTEPCTTSHPHRFGEEGGHLADTRYTVLGTLPTEPAALMDRIIADASGDWSAAWGLVRVLAADLPAPQRAALLGGAATIPGIELIGEVTDAAGRSGVGVGLHNPGSQGLSVIIFDRATLSTSASRSSTTTAASPSTRPSSAPVWWTR